MNTTIQERPSSTAWEETAHMLGKVFAQRAAEHDHMDTFVLENYDLLKKHRLFAAMVPLELGGENLPHAQMCDMLRILAQYCGSTALALSMHQHLLAANIWKYKKGKGGEEMLKKVAQEQLVLVSTGAKDWLESNGSMEKTDGGYLVTAQKHFASQAPAGNILVTSAPYLDPEKGWQVLHFALPMQAKGVRVINNWYTLGMRGTGSHTVALDEVFVPDASVVLQRKRGEYHPIWNVVLTVAMPLIMSVYVGIAEAAAQAVTLTARNKNRENSPQVYLLGEMANELTNAQVLLKDMIRLTNAYDFDPVDQLGNEMLKRKTLVAGACIRTVNKAMEIAGGQGFYRHFGLERLFRDVQGAAYHPLPEKEQLRFSGTFL